MGAVNSNSDQIHDLTNIDLKSLLQLVQDIHNLLFKKNASLGVPANRNDAINATKASLLFKSAKKRQMN